MPFCKYRHYVIHVHYPRSNGCYNKVDYKLKLAYKIPTVDGHWILPVNVVCFTETSTELGVLGRGWAVITCPAGV